MKIKHNIAIGEVIIKGNNLVMDVINNLIFNAIKFNRQDKVEIEIVHSLSDQGKKWKVEFKDNGPGIPDNLKEIIFSKGYRGDHRVQGFGLGLTLVKHIVEGYGGEVWVEDKVKGYSEKGTNFVILFKKGD